MQNTDYLKAFGCEYLPQLFGNVLFVWIILIYISWKAII